MEYRGYDSAGIALLDGEAGSPSRRRAGRLANLEAALAEPAPAALAGHRRPGPHPVGHPRSAHRPQRPPAPRRLRQGSRSCTTASSRTSRRCAGSWRAPAWSSPATPTPRSRCTWSPTPSPHGATAGDFAASVLAVLRRLEGHFTLVFAHADDPGTIVAARRSTPLVVGVGDGEMFVGSDVAAFIEHTREAVELGQDQAVVITADGYRITDFDGNETQPRSAASFTSTGTCRPPKRAATSTSCSRRSPSSPPRSPTPCSATSSTAASCSTSSG